MRNWTSDLHILHSDVLPLSHRDSTLVEAYYSSLRTSHDCFISDVNISTIASFNRMKQITNDLNLVVKAMKTSSMLEVGFTNCFKKYCRLALLKVFFNVICGRYKMNWGQTKGKYLLKGLLISLGKILAEIEVFFCYLFLMDFRSVVMTQWSGERLLFLNHGM